MSRFRPPALRFRPDQLYRVPTDDGSAIALGRYLPRGQRRVTEPVILAHGLGTNRFGLDFDERYSVARGLARRGFEAWVLELRGHGLGGSAEGSTFDLEATHDVGAAIRAVLCATQASKVLWVGHSRGGMLAYAHLARDPAAPILAMVALGAPVTWAASPGLKAFVGLALPFLSMAMIPMALFGKSMAAGGLPPNPVGKYLARAENMEPQVIHQAIAHVTADVPGGVARQFARWVMNDIFDGNDGFDYRAALKEVQVPVLALAGAADYLATPAGVHAATRFVSGPVERVTAGVSTGFSADYGHGDLALGRNAPDEIVPRIADFLRRHATSL